METNSIDVGIITRIYLENFITYDKVMITPGRYLNLIIGPNGTGKSTIVCAIVLGLGGKPSLIGRATLVGEYVKSGREYAKIEIHLKDFNNKNTVICRKFDTTNHTTWLINGQNSSLSNVQQLTTKFNIQIDNLCQFLPQDKVQDFSNMNPQTLLEETERSVGDPMLLVHHLKLKEYRNEHKVIEKFIEDKTKLLQNQTNRHENLKEIVGNIKERKLIKNKILSLKQKKAWMLYDEKRKELVQVKDGREEMAKKVKTLDNALKPLKKTIAKIQDTIKTLQQSTHDYSSQVVAKNTALNRIKESINNEEDAIERSENNKKCAIEAQKTRNDDIRQAQQQKDMLNNDFMKLITEFGTEQELQIKQQEATVNNEKQRNDLDAIKNAEFTLRQQEEQINRQIKDREIQLQTVKDVDAKRLNILKQRSPDAYNGVLWLRNNLDKFTCKIHEPMILSINVKNPHQSKYLESVIPQRDLMAFLCENKQDMNTLLNYLRDEKKLQVNVLYFDPDKNVQMNPHIPIESIMHLGFTNYLISLMEAPKTIMKYLVSTCNLHNIPIGNNIVEENIDRIPNTLNTFFSANNVYNVSISKYTKEKSTRILNVVGNGLLQITLDNSKIHRINEELHILHDKKNSILNDIRTITNKIDETNKKLDDTRELRKQYKQSLLKIQEVKGKINLIEKRIRDLQSDSNTTIEEISNKFNDEAKNIVRKQFQLYKQWNDITEERIKVTVTAKENRLKLRIHQRKLMKKESEFQDLQDEFIQAERMFQKLDEELQPLKRSAEKLYSEALQITDGISPKDRAFKTIDVAFSKLPRTITQIDQEMVTLQTKVYCMGKEGDGENILHEYEQTQKSIEKLKTILQEKNLELEELLEKINHTRERWLPPLEELLQRINMNFSNYFKEMKCVGDVSLTHGANAVDFDQYGLKIMVKFRDSDQLQELTRHHQSGGERAVTTALYMIALQELSRVPFRCVDEINQGMDAINERRVFELLVKITGKTNSSQYFLLTPKLLPALTYSETVTVHCVYNGPFVIPHTDFQIEDYCKNIEHILEDNED